MLRINQQASAAGAKSYFQDGLAREDYYTKDAIVGRWGGKAAAQLGLVGEVTREAFLALCDNLDPNTGKPLTQRTRENRTVGYDFNFHAPKSLSLLYTLTKDERLLGAFQDALRATMQELEADVKTRVRRGGQNAERTTGNLMFVEFVHLTARPVGGIPDPHLHAHCFVFNATFDGEERRWKAGQYRTVVRDAPYFEAAFHARLSKAMTELGFGVVRTKAGWEIAGLDKGLLDKFSRRTALIEELAREEGITDAEEKGRLGARTREKKGEPRSLDELRAEWRGRLTPDERSAVRQVLTVRGSIREPITAGDAVDHALEHCLERASVVQDRRVIAAALKRGYGAVAVEVVREDMERRREVLSHREGDLTLVTTREVLAEEQAALTFARTGRGVCKPLLADGEALASGRLNRDQQDAVRHILTSSDRVMLIRGKAGTGKTTLLTEAVAAIRAAGTAVHLFAPTTEAARGVLRRDGFDDADTVARLLMDTDLQKRMKGQVIWVDEAGLLGMRDLRQLFRIAQEQQARVVLMGDERQHGSVPRGDAFRLLRTHAGLKAAEVGNIQRQRGDYRAAVEALADGDIAGGIERLDKIGAIVELADEARHATLARDYLDTVREGRSTLVVAPTHEEGRVVTELIREQLRIDKRIGAKDRRFGQIRSYGLTVAARQDAMNYAVGDIIRFHQNARGGFRKGERWRVAGRAESGAVLVVRGKGEPVALPVALAKHFDVYEERELKLTTGDRLRITQNGSTADGRGRLLNGSLHTVAGFDRAGNIVLMTGQIVPREFGHLAHGYCTTSHASQGKTVDRVLVALGPESSPAASREQFYVSVSRGRESVKVYCRSKAELREAVASSTARLSATELAARHAESQGVAQRSRLVRLGEHIRRVMRAVGVRRRHESGDTAPARDTLGKQEQHRGPRR